MRQENNPLVFIVVATFNPKENFFLEQIESIVGQTYSNIKVMIVDDVSNVDSAKFIQNICIENNIYFFRQNNNCGPMTNFEFGIQKACELGAELIALSDQDDVWDANKIQILVDGLCKEKCDLIHSDLRLIDDGGKEFESSIFRFESRRKKIHTTEQLFLRNNVTGCSCLFTRELGLKAIPFPKVEKAWPEFYHDHWLALLAFSGNGIDFVEQALGSYRQHGGNLVGAGPGKTVWQRLKGVRLKTDWLTRSCELLNESFANRTGRQLHFSQSLMSLNLAECKILLQWFVGKWVKFILNDISHHQG